MAGRKQHFIPRLLLRAFVDRRDQKVFVFRQDKIYPSAINAGGIAAERDFYSSPDDPSLDDKITAYENSLATMLNSLKQLSHGATVSSEIAAELVVHLTVRAAFFRSIGSTMVVGAFKALREHCTDSNWFDRNFGLDHFRKNSPVGKLITDHLSTQGAKADSLEQLSLIAFEIIQRKKGEVRKSILEVLDSGDAFFEAEAPRVAAKAHQTTLAKEITPEVRVRRLSELRWRIHKATGKTAFFILPDTVAIQFLGNDVSPYLLSTGDDLGAVVLPIRKDTLLVGSQRGTIDRTNINAHLACCSDSFFIGSHRSNDFDRLRTKISSNATRALKKIILAESLKL
jgi:hypothetical protein